MSKRFSSVPHMVNLFNSKTFWPQPLQLLATKQIMRVLCLESWAQKWPHAQHCHWMLNGIWDSFCTKVRDIEGMSTQPHVRCQSEMSITSQCTWWDSVACPTQCHVPSYVHTAPCPMPIRDVHHVTVYMMGQRSMSHTVPCPILSHGTLGQDGHLGLRHRTWDSVGHPKLSYHIPWDWLVLLLQCQEHLGFLMYQ